MSILLITFANPWLLVLLVLIPILVFWHYFKLKKHQTSIQISTTESCVKHKSIKPKLLKNIYILQLLAIILIIIAIARPQSTSSKQNVSVEGIDLILSLDISGSMLAEDFKPNRLGAAKDVAMDFIKMRENDRIGLVIFSGESFTQCPLTSDHSVLINMFGSIKSGIIDDGTALGDGLATSVNRLKNSFAKSKVIILLTDGINNSGFIDPMLAAEMATLYNIRVYTIGVGKMGYAPYPVQTPFGISYQNMEVQIDEKLLQQIANMTGGKYFRATNKENLKLIYQEIDKMEKTKIDITEYTRKKEEYFIFALIAIILIAIERILKYTYLKNIP